MTDSTVPPPPAPPPAPDGEDTTVAVLAYVTPILCLVGFVIPIIMHNNKKTKLGAYHLRQSLGLILAAIALSVALMIVGFVLHFIPVLGPLVSMLLHIALSLGCLALMIMGVMAASKREMKPLPVVGPYFEKWFGTVFD